MAPRPMPPSKPDYTVRSPTPLGNRSVPLMASPSTAMPSDVHADILRAWQSQDSSPRPRHIPLPGPPESIRWPSGGEPALAFVLLLIAFASLAIGIGAGYLLWGGP